MRRVDSTIPARMESRDSEIFRSHHIQFSDLQRRRPSEKFLGTRNRIRRFPPFSGIRPDKYQTACRRPDIRPRQRVAERQRRRIHALWNDQRHNFPGIRQKIRTPGQNCPTRTRQILHLLSAFRYADRQLLFIQ